MKRAVFIMCAAVFLVSLTSCEKVVGEGPLQAETRSVTGFTGIQSSVGGNINFKIEPVYKVEIIAQRNILDVIETNKVNGRLVVKIRNGVHIRTNEDIVVNVSAPAADYIHNSGSGTVQVAGTLAGAGLDLGISGSGNMYLPSVAVSGNLKATISGSGNIEINSGTVANEELNISGSGKITADAVAAEISKATISGSGDIRLKATQTLDATISGSGSVYYRGNPVISTHISGSGRVRPL